MTSQLNGSGPVGRAGPNGLDPRPGCLDDRVFPGDSAGIECQNPSSRISQVVKKERQVLGDKSGGRFAKHPMSRHVRGELEHMFGGRNMVKSAGTAILGCLTRPAADIHALGPQGGEGGRA